VKPLVLIDGDQFVFKATVALEKEVRWDDQNHVLYSNVEECWDNLKGMLERVLERFNSREHALCFSADPNFRKAIDPDYKGHRSPRKPLCYAAMLERVKTDYRVVAMPGLEADDVMGILATKPGNAERATIVSQDKDMKSIPVTVWDGKDLVKITAPEANYWHLYQTLIGDTSDGYKGCPGTGPVKAKAILEGWPTAGINGDQGTPREAWAAVVEAYTKAGLTEADALTQARLARILRWSDWDGAKKEPILWSPK
jgi:5'-3' exonuclease